MSAHPEAADRVLIAARVHTVSDILPSAEAVAIKGGRIQDVGSAEAIMARAGPGTRVDRLDGKTILPGFVETHTHLLLFGGTLGWVDCRTPPNRSIDDLLERLAERVGATPAGEWVRGWGYDDTLLSDGRHPTRWDLDRVAPEHPVYLAHVSWHSAAVNSRALEMARVGPDAEVADGTLVRDHATGD